MVDVIKFLSLGESEDNTVTVSPVADLCVGALGLTGRLLLLTGLTVALEHTLDSSSVPLPLISRWTLVGIVLKVGRQFILENVIHF